jgi:hypothetical protein
MHYIALMALRVPARRDGYVPAMRQMAESMMAGALRSREVWEEQVAAMRSDGIDIDSSYDEMKAFIDSGEYSIDVANEFHVSMMLAVHFDLAKLLGCRTWVLGVAADAGQSPRSTTLAGCRTPSASICRGWGREISGLMCWHAWSGRRAIVPRRPGRKEPEVAFVEGNAKGGGGLVY